MSDRGTVNQRVQIAPETTPGTFVTATKYLQSLSIKPEIKAETMTFTPEGSKYATIVVEGREWSVAPYDGVLTYSEIVYPLCGVAVNVSPVIADVSAEVWGFAPDQSAPDSVKTFSIEHGTPGVAAFGEHFAFGQFNSLKFNITRKEAKISGDILGQLMTTGSAISGGTTAVELQPVIPSNVSVYLDTTYKVNGTTPDIVPSTATKLLRVFECDFELSNRFAMVWPLDGAQTSWAALVEAKPKASGKIKMEADAAAVDPTTGLLAQLRGASTRYLTIQAISPIKAGSASVKYAFLFQAAIKISDPKPYSDHEGVYAIEFDWEAVYDPTLLAVNPSATAYNANGGAYFFQVSNKIASL